MSSVCRASYKFRTQTETKQNVDTNNAFMHLTPHYLIIFHESLLVHLGISAAS
jgi:hypothetical protein